jgi:lipid A disaccharide synthetase
LINLVLSKNSVQELIQSNCNKKNIYKSILNLFLDKDIIENQLSDLKEFKRVIIGDKKNPSEKAANRILEYLKD